MDIRTILLRIRRYISLDSQKRDIFLERYQCTVREGDSQWTSKEVFMKYKGKLALGSQKRDLFS
jgi:hypothetical protein